MITKPVSPLALQDSSLLMVFAKLVTNIFTTQLIVSILALLELT